MGWDQIGQVGGNRPLISSYRQTSGQSFSNSTVANVNFQTTILSNAPLTKTSTYFVTSAAGYWVITCQFALAWVNTATERRIAIRSQNGSNYVDLAVQAANCTNGLVNATAGPIYLASSTTIAARGAQWSGSSTTTLVSDPGTDADPGQFSWITFQYLGATL